MTDVRRSLPSVRALLDEAALAPLLARAPRGLVRAVVRDTVAAVREGRIDLPRSAQAWVECVSERLMRAERPSLRRVINATGVVLHTNLGRAPLAQAAIDAMTAVAGGYTNLEYDLDRGTRGTRLVHARGLLSELTDAEDALVVNNCAAAMVLALRALAFDREVLVSRGELVEIGGSFRVPDIMVQADVRLVEVCTTNRTHLDDYRRALRATTGAIVKVHRSNFAMDGFVADVSVRELSVIAAEAGIPLLHDFGSGLMLDLAPWGLAGEPTTSDAVASGADIVMLSGDKLLGGPQAGILLGKRHAIAALRVHPLARALRVDKITLAALEATLALYRDPSRAVREIPTLAMLTTPLPALQERASAIAAQLTAAGIEAAPLGCEGAVGGGAFPTARLASVAVRLGGESERWERALRAASTPVVGRVADGALVLDVRTVLPAEEAALVGAVRESAP